jgi:hypothetical protein
VRILYDAGDLFVLLTDDLTEVFNGADQDSASIA